MRGRILIPFYAMIGVAGSARGAEPDVDFNRDIRLILSANCFACHGRDEEAREADLRLDTREGTLRDLGGYRVLEPGKPDDSELIARVESADKDDLMPPPDSGHELTAEEKQKLRDWVAAGGEYQTHWSFEPPVRASLPPVKEKKWARRPIDHFVLAGLEAKGLTPSEPSDGYRLIRRLSLDLTGLPPTPEEADAFVAEESDEATANVVDRLLASKAFGEHWARMWLDLARYADTKGYEKDKHRDIWRYRDWVIEAFNRNLPFDQFTIEQLAGDLLPAAAVEQQLATAFHRNTMSNDEGGTDNEEFRVAAVKDRVDTTIQVWMGLTMGCAKCHSHKYDPIGLDDYYSLYAFFNQTEDADLPSDAPHLLRPTPEQTRRIKQLDGEVNALKAKVKKAPEKTPEREKLQKDLEKAQKSLQQVNGQVSKTPIMRELAADKQRESRIHNRGNFLDPGEPVESGVPAVFGAWPEGAPRNRLGVAHWLVQPENPLTARVMVNRVWARLFGIGIVETEEDFGSQGLNPSHPELLDWLAVDFRENGWSLKKLIRSIVLSSTYRQSAGVDPERLAADPGNRLLSRGARYRLPAETVRDQALAASGLLTRKIGGPSVMPPQPDGVWKSTYSNLSWKDSADEDRYRRGLYTYWKRTSPYPAMITFDAGSGEVCQIRRVRTNTPLQALVTLNDPAFVEAAGALAGRMTAEKVDLPKRIVSGFRRVLIRPPSEKERDRLVALYESMRAEFSEDPDAARALLESAGREQGDAAMVAVANVLLNLDETLMKP